MRVSHSVQIHNYISFLPQGLIPLATLGLALSGSLTTNVQSSGEQSRDSLQDLDRAEAVFKTGIHTFSKKIDGFDPTSVVW